MKKLCLTVIQSVYDYLSIGSIVNWLSLNKNLYSIGGSVSNLKCVSGPVDDKIIVRREDENLFPELDCGRWKLTISPKLHDMPIKEFSKETLCQLIQTEYTNVCKLTPIHVMSFSEKRQYYPTSCKVDNWSKNRYPDVLCVESTRVKLNRDVCLSRYVNYEALPAGNLDINEILTMGSPTREDESESDFINANYVKLDEQTSQFVATQAPLTSTFSDFFEMIWNLKSKVIVTLTSVVEDGKKKMDVYWPTDGLECFGHFGVELIKKTQENSVIIRELRLHNYSVQETRNICQFHFQEWPDRGVPVSPQPLIQLNTMMKKYQMEQNCVSPPVIHCSAGIGRTGVFVTISSCIEIIDALQKQFGKAIPRLVLNDKLDIHKLTLKLRQQRAGCIQNWKQYSFIYKALNFYLTL